MARCQVEQQAAAGPGLRAARAGMSCVCAFGARAADRGAARRDDARGPAHESRGGRTDRPHQPFSNIRATSAIRISSRR